MFDAIRSEFRKLLTVRATYGLILGTLVMVILFAGLAQGYNASTYDLQRTELLAKIATSSLVFGGLLLAFVGLLLVGNEYRFTTIMYTLTSSNRRFKNVAAKVAVVTVFSLVTSLFVALFAPLCAVVAIHLHGMNLVPQNFNYVEVIARCLFVGWGYAMFAVILVMILRNQIGAIVTFLMLPLVGENILILLLKDNGRYLPFTALQSVSDPGMIKGASTATGIIVTLLYVGIGLVVSAVLFSRRDAN